LSALADPGSLFAGWSGACTGTGACTVTMDAARTVAARFDLGTFTLRIDKTPLLPSILGTVTSTPAGINCGLLCGNQSATFPSGTVVTLTAQAAVLASFAGWRGDCSGGGTCVVTMDANKAVTADFALLGLGAGMAVPGSRREAPGAEVDVGFVKSTLKVRGGRGEVTINGRTLLLAAEGEAYAPLSGRSGQNLLEAWVREDPDGGGGIWRFDFVPALEPGGLRVLAGEAVAVTPDSIAFRLTGRPGERVSFVLRVPAGREGSLPP
jgi:hypothetical protein